MVWTPSPYKEMGKRKESEFSTISRQEWRGKGFVRMTGEELFLRCQEGGRAGLLMQ